MSARTAFFDGMVRRAVVTFLAMAVSFVVFGALTVDLAKHMAANAEYLLSYGGAAWLDGGLAQLAELWIKVLMAIAAWLSFKLCEHALVERVAHGAPPPLPGHEPVE
ncbi:MAG TPA: hypothetical protein PKD29_04910 [Rhodocyclaceae bacterium]|nr:hypothetical protein [Rhodocyclaceae bacterium]